ncbi:MAG: hypothetical protein ABSG46_16395 [Candidatus Binataceae bacterium]
MSSDRNYKRALGLVIALVGFVSACAPAAPGPSTAQPIPNENGAPPAATEIQPPSYPSASAGTPAGQFEQPPIVDISELLPPSELSGPGYQLEPQVPTNGAMGQYVLTADSEVFHDAAGTYQVESLDLLKIRLSEAPAIAQLENMSQSAVFAKELATSAERPVADAANMVMHPMDTVTGLPSGVGEFFGRVGGGAEELYSTATNSSESGGARASQTAEETGNITLTALGYDQVRRDLAKQVHVDPYSSDPVLTRLLNHIAWVMFSARLAVNTAVTVAVPGSIIITGTEFTDDLIYQTPKGDLIMLVHNKLKDIGLSPKEIATFSANSAIPLSLQVTAVHELERLGDIPGRRGAAVMLGSVMTEYQARFLVTSLQMLADWSAQKSPLTGIQIQGILVAQDQNGTSIVPAPIDYLSWTPRIAGFATNPALLALPNRVIWIPAKMTPLAQQQLAANGWTVQTDPQP